MNQQCGTPTEGHTLYNIEMVRTTVLLVGSHQITDTTQIQQQCFNYVNRFTMVFSPTSAIHNKIFYNIYSSSVLKIPGYFSKLIPPAATALSILRSLLLEQITINSATTPDLSVIGTIYPLTLESQSKCF